MKNHRRAMVPIASTLVLAAGLLAAGARATTEVYPEASWSRVEVLEKAGWSRAGLDQARRYSTTIATAAVMIVAGGQVVDAWGEIDRRFNVHSIRKSFLSALYGIYVAGGTIDLSVTLEDLGIDDNEPSLTEVEKQAILHDVLKARSGIYHAALYETPGMAAARPARGSHAPGTFWYYNNWDFNVLGTIFERLAKRNLFRSFREHLAEPIGMEDFRLQDGVYVGGPDSVYPAYPFRMTARDMARFGLLFLREGRWNDRQIVPRDWVSASVTSYSDAGASGGYGYMWWVAADGRHFSGVSLPDGSYSARGAGGHYILVVPDYDLVVVHRVNTDGPGPRVSGKEFGELVRLILAARSR